MIEQALIIVEAEQERADERAAGGVAKAADDAVSRAEVLDLEHGAHAGPVGQVETLGDDAIERAAAGAASQLARRPADQWQARGAGGSRERLSRKSIRGRRAAREGTIGKVDDRPAPAADRRRSAAQGVSPASLRMRLSAGWSRGCRASKESVPPTGITSSPSSTNRFFLACPASHGHAEYDGHDRPKIGQAPAARPAAGARCRAAMLDDARPQTVARQRKRNRWTAREGIAALADQASFVEYGGLVRPAMAGMEGAADGLVMGTARVDGRPSTSWPTTTPSMPARRAPTTTPRSAACSTMRSRIACR